MSYNQSYEYQKKALARLAETLMAAGWNVNGYHEDKSDMMTDYYSPAYWSGHATPPGVDVDSAAPGTVRIVCGRATSKATRHEYVREDLGECPRCNGTAIDPALKGWTLQSARENPREWNKAEAKARIEVGDRSIPLMPDIVSPSDFDGGPVGGLPGCKEPFCREGRIMKGRHVETSRGPEFAAVERVRGKPHPFVWVERVDSNGVPRILKTWTQAKAMAAREGYEAELAKVIDYATAYAAGMAEVPSPYGFGSGPATGDGPQITPGTRPGYVELRYAAKPDDAVRAALKAAGFRWSRQHGCWYGLEARMPAGVLAGGQEDNADGI